MTLFKHAARTLNVAALIIIQYALVSRDIPETRQSFAQKLSDAVKIVIVHQKEPALISVAKIHVLTILAMSMLNVTYTIMLWNALVRLALLLDSITHNVFKLVVDEMTIAHHKELVSIRDASILAKNSDLVVLMRFVKF